MANYAVERARYGGMVGTIQPFVRQLDSANDPMATQFRSKLPAGFLRCDGSIIQADLYPALAEVLGLGRLSKFAKDPTALAADEFQLPDIGSKYIVPGAATGTYLSEFLSDGTTRRVAAEFDVRSNRGNTASVSYTGNFTLANRSGDVEGNPFYSAPTDSFTAFVGDTFFQGHGHGSNAQVLNCTGNYLVSPGLGPQSSSDSHSGNNCKTIGGNTLAAISNPAGATATSAQHSHVITMPTSPSAYSHNFDWTYSTTQVPPTGLTTEVNITTTTTTTFDTTVAPFILVEYIIKF